AEVTSRINCENVIVPSPTQVPAPTAALNVVGSHLSFIRTAKESLAIKTTEDAMEIATSAAARHTLPLFMGFPFLSKIQLSASIRRKVRRSSVSGRLRRHRYAEFARESRQPAIAPCARSHRPLRREAPRQPWQSPRQG